MLNQHACMSAQTCDPKLLCHIVGDPLWRHCHQKSRHDSPSRRTILQPGVQHSDCDYTQTQAAVACDWLVAAACHEHAFVEHGPESMLCLQQGLTLSCSKSCQIVKAPLLISFWPTCSPVKSDTMIGRPLRARNCNVFRQDLTSHSVNTHSLANACMTGMSIPLTTFPRTHPKALRCFMHATIGLSLQFLQASDRRSMPIASTARK